MEFRRSRSMRAVHLRASYFFSRLWLLSITFTFQRVANRLCTAKTYRSIKFFYPFCSNFIIFLSSQANIRVDYPISISRARIATPTITTDIKSKGMQHSFVLIFCISFTLFLFCFILCIKDKLYFSLINNNNNHDDKNLK